MDFQPIGHSTSGSHERYKSKRGDLWGKGIGLYQKSMKSGS